VQRDGDRACQRHGQHDDQQPDQPARLRPQRRFTPGRNHIGVCITLIVSHVIIAGGWVGEVNRPRMRKITATEPEPA
jgi:hypothetical protein